MPRMYCSHVAYCTTLNVQTLTTSRLPRDPGSQGWSYTLLFLDVPIFTTSRLPRDLSTQRWNYVGEKWPMNFARNARLPLSIQESFTCTNLRHGTDGFTSPPKDGVLRIFSPWKIRLLRPGLNPRTWVPKASTLPLDHRIRWIRLRLAKFKTLQQNWRTKWNNLRESLLPLVFTLCCIEKHRVRGVWTWITSQALL